MPRSLLKTLLWLPMSLKIKPKVTAMTYNAPDDLALSYILPSFESTLPSHSVLATQAPLLFFKYTNHAPISGCLGLPYNFSRTVFLWVPVCLTLSPHSHLWSNVSISERNNLAPLTKNKFSILCNFSLILSCISSEHLAPSYILCFYLFAYILFSLIGSRSTRTFVCIIYYYILAPKNHVWNIGYSINIC